MADTKDLELVFNGKSWVNKDLNVTFKAGTVATIKLDSSLVIDKKLKRPKQKKNKKTQIFEDGDELLVALKQPLKKPLPDELMDTFYDKSKLSFCDSPYLSARFSLSSYSFVKVTLKQADSSTFPTEAGVPKGTGWYEDTPFQKGAVHCGTIVLPEAVQVKVTPKSLNHAYTLLSERIELDRMSHTGNVYQLIFYKESDGKWYPLDKLRNPSSFDNAEMIVSKLWRELKDINLTSS